MRQNPQVECFMPTYFKPLRRKIGIATLVVACVFAAAWVRSLRVGDRLSFPAFGTDFHLVSLNGYVDWERVSQLAAPIPVSWRSGSTSDIATLHTFHRNRRSFKEDSLRKTGRPVPAAPTYANGSIAYWSIVIPLTLLSAWLLLSKPRAGKVTEPKLDSLS